MTVHCAGCGAEIDVNPLAALISTRCTLCAGEPATELPTETLGVTPVIVEFSNDGIVAGFEWDF